jgi:hypothetical protein
MVRRWGLSTISVWGAAALAVLAATQPWTQLVTERPARLAGYNFVVTFHGDFSGGAFGFLKWQNAHPPTALLVLMAAAAVGLAALASVAGLRRRVAALALPVALVFGVLFALGNPMPWPWQLPSQGVHLAPTWAYWAAVAGLALSLLASVAAVLSSRRPSEA